MAKFENIVVREVTSARKSFRQTDPIKERIRWLADKLHSGVRTKVVPVEAGLTAPHKEKKRWHTDYLNSEAQAKVVQIEERLAVDLVWAIFQPTGMKEK